MNLYTFVVEFRGGTYILQVMAQDETRAVEAWAARFAIEKPAGRASKHVVRNVLDDLPNDPPTPLTGLSGAWCCSAIVGGDLVLINVVLSK